MKGAPLVQPSDPGDRYRHTRRQADQPTTRVKVGNVVFGGERLVVAAGPCSVEPDGSLLSIAQAVAESGASMLRGGAYKPRTSPYDFQGLGPEGLRLLSAARAATGLPVVTEVLDPRDVDLVARHADMFQIGSRSIQNYPLLHEVAAAGLPVLLKRGMMTTVDEWLSSAEYLLDAGPVRICPWPWIPAMRPATHRWCRRSVAPPWPSAPTGSWSKSIPIRPRPSATATSRSRRRISGEPSPPVVP